MHLLLKLISTLGLSWVSAQHEMPEFVGGCAAAFNQLQICKYLLNWLTLSVERFFVLNLKKVPPHATVQRGRNSKSFAILPQPRPKKPQEFRSTQQWKTAVIWQWLTVALCLSFSLSVPLPLCLSIQLMRKTCLLSSNKCNRLSYIIYIYE